MDTDETGFAFDDIVTNEEPFELTLPDNLFRL